MDFAEKILNLGKVNTGREKFGKCLKCLHLVAKMQRRVCLRETRVAWNRMQVLKDSVVYVQNKACLYVETAKSISNKSIETEPTFLAAVISRFTTTISVIIRTLVTAASTALAARMIFALSPADGSPSPLTGISVKLLIIEAASFASAQASFMSAANSGFSLAISSPIFTKYKMASFSFVHTFFRALRACPVLFSLVFLWLINVVIWKQR